MTITQDTNEWSAAFASQALQEGWGLDDSHQIVRDDDARVFDSDDKALDFVLERALRGSQMHAIALAMHVKAKAE